ncbi:MAG: NAD(P)/FAD-dependent oxidoreductase [Saprospiraceae bacterium]
MTKISEKKIAIVGAGLVGSLLALRLLQRGLKVEIFESREDMRKQTISAGRSINLALSHRGIRGLNLVGLEDKILEHAVQMKGRMIHKIDSELSFQAYSIRDGEYINSISRRTLNIILLDAIESFGVKVNFGKKLHSFLPEKNLIYFEDKNNQQSQVEDSILIATDGANSMARKFMLDRSAELKMNYNQKFQEYGYKELNILPGKNGEFLLEKNALHIWPRGHFMMIALANPDATFTATLFLPFKGEQGFESLTDKNSVNNFFEKYFKDAKELIHDLDGEFFQHPIGHLNSVKCKPWHYEDKLLLMGDAAHAIIPFYGQGMNCGFEDVVVFNELLDKYNDTLELFEQFEKSRKINSDAISDLAEDNFEEMRDKVADPIYQRKRTLEAQLEKQFPSYYSKYALVTFCPDVSYSEAMIRGRKQDDYLMNLCMTKTDFTNEDLGKIFKELESLNL